MRISGLTGIWRDDMQYFYSLKEIEWWEAADTFVKELDKAAEISNFMRDTFEYISNE